jgi:hypothetical protein
VGSDRSRHYWLIRILRICNFPAMPVGAVIARYFQRLARNSGKQIFRLMAPNNGRGGALAGLYLP